MDEGNNSQNVSRRRLLQLLAASGAAVGLGRLLPVDWITPSAQAAPESDTVLVPELPPGCQSDDFRLRVRSRFVSNLGSVPDGTTTNWSIRFGYNDSSSQLSAAALITAVVNDTGHLHQVYNAYPLSKVGTLEPYSTEKYSTICNGVEQVVIRTIGNGTFNFTYTQANGGFATQAVQANPTVDYFLTDAGQRSSNVEQTELVEGPTAVSLSDLSASADNSGLKTAAAVAGAAALGAATLAAMKKGETAPDSAE